MLRQVQLTADGSHTISIPELNLLYHSHHGAMQESMHVFIRTGLLPMFERFPNDTIRVLEIGFGTGLNALLTAREALAMQRGIHYTAIEKYPLTPAETAELNHGNLLFLPDLFTNMHASEWESDQHLLPGFTLQKLQLALPAKLDMAPVHCIYLDAFAPQVQPELWSRPFFDDLYACLLPGGILVTYCSKSIVRRALADAGFTVTKPPGPYGKRDMVRAEK